MITGLDHVVVAVRALRPAVADYQTLLGRAPSWQGEALGGDAEVVAFGLPNVALELIAPAGNGPGAERLRAVLDAQGEGLASVAFAVDDIEAAHRRLGRVGLDPGSIDSAEAADRATGQRRRWRRTRASTEATAGVRIFLVQGEPVPASAPAAAEPASAVGLDHVVIRSPDPDRAAALYGARLGLDLRLDRSSPAWGARLLFFRCGDLTVEIAHDLGAGVSSGADRLRGLSWRVPDAEAARHRLHAAGVDVTPVRAGRKAGTLVFTARDRTAGVPTLLLQPATGGP